MTTVPNGGMMPSVRDLARSGRLYPSIILYGATAEERQSEAVHLARTLLCAADEAERPCGACRPCRRIAWPGNKDDRFHPDFHVLLRDRRTATSVDATKAFLSQIGQAPFEARGQIFVIGEAESLHPGAADALLKVLEEPPGTTPRTFLLLAATERDLLPTVRSRSLSVFLGAAEPLDEEAVARLAGELQPRVARFFEHRMAVDLLAIAEALGAIDGWADPRARRPWATAAAVLMRLTEPTPETVLQAPQRRALLEAAAALLDGPRLRLRGIPHGRITEGLLSRHLAGRATSRAASPRQHVT